jgi:hypothetical protein
MAVLARMRLYRRLVVGLIPMTQNRGRTAGKPRGIIVGMQRFIKFGSLVGFPRLQGLHEVRPNVGDRGETLALDGDRFAATIS